MLLGTASIIPSTTACVSVPQPLPAKNAPANISGRRGYFYEQLLWWKMLTVGRGRRRQLGKVICSPGTWGSRRGCLSAAIVCWGRPQDHKANLPPPSSSAARCREEVQKWNYYLHKIFLHVAEMKWLLHRSEAGSLSPNGSQRCVFKMKCIKKKKFLTFFWYSIPTLAFRARGCIRRYGRKPKGGWSLEGKGLRAVGSQSQNRFQV